MMSDGKAVRYRGDEIKLWYPTPLHKITKRYWGLVTEVEKCCDGAMFTGVLPLGPEEREIHRCKYDSDEHFEEAVINVMKKIKDEIDVENYRSRECPMKLAKKLAEKMEDIFGKQENV